MGKPKRQHGSGRGKLKAPHLTADDVPPQQQTPVFCLKHLGGRYCLSQCTTEHQAAFANALHKLSQLSWGEIARANRRGCGYEQIAQGALKGSLPRHVTEDVNILAFRYCGKRPMVGYRDGRVFHVLFLDRDFTLYDHGS